MIPSLIFLAVVLAAAAVVFEIWVVKKGGKYTGLVLPGLTFLLSFLFLYLFTNGSMIDAGGYIVTILVLNIPTVILVLIYFVASKERKEEKRGKDAEGLDSMRIKDL